MLTLFPAIVQLETSETDARLGYGVSVYGELILYQAKTIHTTHTYTDDGKRPPDQRESCRGYQIT